MNAEKLKGKTIDELKDELKGVREEYELDGEVLNESI